MQYVGFTMGSGEYTVPILKVQEIMKMPRLTKIPQSPPFIEGVTDLRGKIIPIVNLKKLAGLSGKSADENVMIVSSGRITFGVIVDSITGVVTIDESEIYPPTDLSASEIVSGVARVNDKVVMLLDTNKLIPMSDMSVFEDEILEVKDIGDGKMETVKEIDGMGGKTIVKEVVNAKDFLKNRNIDLQDPRFALFDDIVKFMDAIVTQDYDRANVAIGGIMKGGQGDLFKEVGRVTRKLHDSIKSFKEAIDPKLRGIATSDVPNAIDSLQFVIDKTEDAATQAMNTVEKHILEMDDLASHIRNLNGPEESVDYLKSFKNELEDDLTKIITTQSFQDLTGQTIKKVIKLVADIEEELIKLIATFGVKIEEGMAAEVVLPEKVSQEDVDDLLKDFGF